MCKKQNFMHMVCAFEEHRRKSDFKRGGGAPCYAWGPPDFRVGAPLSPTPTPMKKYADNQTQAMSELGFYVLYFYTW